MKPINKLIQVLLITFIISSCSNAKIKNSLKEDGLKGDVKRVTILEYHASMKFGEPHADSLNTKTVDVYDKRGNLIEEYVYNSKDSLNNKAIKKYDFEDNQIERLYSDFEDSSSNCKSVFIYDKKGNQTQGDVFNSNNVLIERAIFKYDSLGNYIEEDYNADGSLKEKTITKFDKKGNISESFVYDQNDSLSQKESYIYNKDDKVIEYDKFQKTMDSTVIDAIMEAMYPDPNKNDFGAELNRVLMRDKVKEFIKEANTKETYKFISFDKNGNWLKKVEIGKCNVTILNSTTQPQVDYIRIIERTIEYY